MKKIIFQALVFVSLALSFLPSLVLALEKGDTYLNFTLTDLNGREVELRSLIGKVIFLDVWASWCAPCAKEMPFLVDAYEKFKDQGFVVVAVSVDDKKSSIKSFFQRKMNGKIPDFPVLHDPDKKVPKLYRMVGIPGSVLIGSDGKIAVRPRTGFEESHAAAITRQIEEALAK